MSRFFFIWMVMLGAMVGVRDKLHFDVDVWPDLSPRKKPDPQFFIECAGAHLHRSHDLVGH